MVMLLRGRQASACSVPPPGLEAQTEGGVTWLLHGEEEAVLPPDISHRVLSSMRHSIPKCVLVGCNHQVGDVERIIEQLDKLAEDRRVEQRD